MSREPTIYDVAKQAGVSISTVSRVLNRHPSVLPGTRDRVLTIIAQLQFKPNPIARGLVVKHTNVLEVFFSWPGYDLNFSDSWYMTLLNGVSDAARKGEYGLLINTLAGHCERGGSSEKAFEGIVDGLLLLAPRLDKELADRMHKERVPTVVTNCRCEDGLMDWVDTDNAGGASLLAEHLVSLGHKNIGVITGPLENAENAVARLRGFDERLAALGLPTPDAYRVKGDFTDASGEKAMEKLLDLPSPPTAVFASNDSMALGAARIIRKRGMKLGLDVSLVGYDNIREAGSPEFDLTTVDAQTALLGSEAVDLLISKIHAPSKEWVPQHLVVPVNLVTRTSTAPPRKTKRA
jgi:DNA-binding LacI/PurR family transcriptional regulator